MILVAYRWRFRKIRILKSLDPDPEINSDLMIEKT
jgi:hypothetical protein